MKQITARIRGLLLLTVLIAAGFSHAQEPIVVESPLFVTSAGQSADAALVEVVLRRTGITATLGETASAADLQASEAKTLIVVLGGSQKGLGAAGINPEEELERVNSLLDKADELGVTLVGMHVGGEGRRGPLSARFITSAAPRMHLLIVTEEGNADGYFDEVAAEAGIQLIMVADTFQVGSTLNEFLAE